MDFGDEVISQQEYLAVLEHLLPADIFQAIVRFLEDDNIPLCDEESKTEEDTRIFE